MGTTNIFSAGIVHTPFSQDAGQENGGAMRSDFILEIAVFNIESALLAAASGADRIELCENPADGGTTSSYGTLKTVREKIDISVFPIVRARGGDFLYSDEEFE